MSEFIVIGQRAEDGIAIDFSKPAVGELVRCKYCKYSRVADMDDQEDGYLCSLLRGHEFFSYDYCSYGERKEQERNIFLDESIDETAGYGEEQEHE